MFHQTNSNMHLIVCYLCGLIIVFSIFAVMQSQRLNDATFEELTKFNTVNKIQCRIELIRCVAPHFIQILRVTVVLDTGSLYN